MAHPALAVPAALLPPVVLDVGGMVVSIPALIIGIPLAPFSLAVATYQAILGVISAFVAVVVSLAAALAVGRGADRLAWAEARGEKRLEANAAVAGFGGHIGAPGVDLGFHLLPGAAWALAAGPGERLYI